MRGIPVTDQDGNRIGESKVMIWDLLKLNELLISFLNEVVCFIFSCNIKNILLTNYINNSISIDQ